MSEDQKEAITLPLIVGATGLSRDNPNVGPPAIRPTAILFLQAQDGQIVRLPLDEGGLLALHRIVSAAVKGFDDPSLPGPVVPPTIQ